MGRFSSLGLTIVSMLAFGLGQNALAQQCDTVGDGTITDVGYDQASSFTYTGADQPFTVPAGTVSIKIQAWGAGGGGLDFAVVNTISGGAGGYTEGVMPVSSGDTLVVVVGGGGDFNRATGGSTPATYGGGGEGDQTTTGNLAEVGAGGGLSGVFSDSVTQANALVIAGGGGGCGDGTFASRDESSGGNGNIPVTVGYLPLQGQNGGEVSTLGFGGGGGGYVGGISGVDVFSWRGIVADAGEGGHGFVGPGLTDGVILGSAQEIKLPPMQGLAQYISGAGLGGQSPDNALGLAPSGGNGLVVIQLECVLDEDGDGVLDVDDFCPMTAASDPDDGVPGTGLRRNRWADMDGDGEFDTNGDNPTGRFYSMTDTLGCNCAQIIDLCGYGAGHEKFGCSISVMDWWTGLYDQAGEDAAQCH